MDLSIIIVNYNVKYFLEQCLHSVNRALGDIPAEVYVVDNSSVDGSAAMVQEKFPRVKLIRNDENLGLKNKEYNQPNLNELVKPSLLNHPFRINFSKADFLLFREIKKHTKSIALAAIFFTMCLLLYGSYIGLDMYQQSIRLAQLEMKYDESVKQYLPKGVSKSNAISILKNQVLKLNQNRTQNRKFAKRDYFISRMLADLSSLKANVSSLHLNRFSYNKQVMRFQGTVSTIADVELLKEKLESLFPQNTHSIKINQRSMGNESVELSTSIHFQK